MWFFYMTTQWIFFSFFCLCVRKFENPIICTEKKNSSKKNNFQVFFPGKPKKNYKSFLEQKKNIENSFEKNSVFVVIIVDDDDNLYKQQQQITVSLHFSVFSLGPAASHYYSQRICLCVCAKMKNWKKKKKLAFHLDPLNCWRKIFHFFQTKKKAKTKIYPSQNPFLSSFKCLRLLLLLWWSWSSSSRAV